MAANSTREGFQNTPAMKLRCAYLTMHRAFDALFARHGFTADQFVLMKVLSEEEGVKQRELIDKISSDPNTVSAMLALLEKRRIIRRKANAGDGRARSVFLTAAGRRALQTLVQSSDRLHALMEECVPRRERKIVYRALDRITQQMASARSRLARPARGRARASTC